MESITLWARHGEAVRQAIELGAIAHIETASEECTDEFFLLAIESGLRKSGAGSFPAPRQEPEMAMEVSLPAHSAARFAGRYARRQAGYVLRAARVWGALGSSVAVVEPAGGLSARGTAADQLWSGDVVRNRWVQMERQADLSQPGRRPPQEPNVAVTVRERASRRAVTPAVDAAEAAARAPQVAEPWVRWDTQPGGVSMLRYGRLGQGRRLHSRDTTHGAVPWETGTEEWSGVVKNEDGTLSRGSKLATWRTLRARAGLLTPGALAAIQGHALAWCRPWLAEAPGWRAGDLLLDDRGVLDGATGSDGKRQRRVAVLIPRNANRRATQEAIALAEMADQWHAPPPRGEQRRALVRGVEHLGTAWAVPLHAWVMRFWQKKKQRTAPSVLVTTDLEVNAPWMGRPYAERPEIDQD